MNNYSNRHIQKPCITVHLNQQTTNNRLTQMLKQKVQSKYCKFSVQLQNNSLINNSQPDYTISYQNKKQNKNDNQNKYYHFIFLPIQYHARFPNYLFERVNKLLKIKNQKHSQIYNQNNIIILVLIESSKDSQQNQNTNYSSYNNYTKFNQKNKSIHKYKQQIQINQKQAIIHFDYIQQVCLTLNINCLPCFDLKTCKEVFQTFIQS